MTATADVPRLPHRVTIVGGGFAGLYAAKSLGIDPEVRLTLVDRRNFHLFQPLLYQVATGALSPGDIAQPLRSILRKQRNTTVILGEAIGIDPERREVLLADEGPIAYDTLIVATGAHHTYFDHPEWASIAPGLKTLEDATEIRRRILIAFEAAEREADPERRKAWMTFVLVGGGPTGVELAGALGEIAHDTLKRDFRSIRSGEARIILIEAMDRVLPPYPPRSVRVGAAPAREARGRGPDVDAGRRPARGRCPRDRAPTGRRRPSRRARSSGPRVSSARASPGPSRRRPGPRRTGPGGSSSSPT